MELEASSRIALGVELRLQIVHGRMGIWAHGKQEIKNQHTTSSIEQTVSGLDGIVNSIGASVVIDLPETETNLWHIIAAVQLDGWNCWCHLCEI